MTGWLALIPTGAFAGLEITDLGKTYTCDRQVTPAWLQNHIERDEDVIGGNTSVRKETVDSLDWKGSPNANGYGYAYRHRSGEPFGVQPGQLRYFRFDPTGDDEIVLRGGKRYVFMIGFDEPGRDRGLGIAITTKVHKLDAAEFDRDSNGAIRWAVRREGDGTLPPTTIDAAEPPAELRLRSKLIRESTFPSNHWDTLRPTSKGYPDVDTYRTRQFYIETKPVLLQRSDNDAAADIQL
jgi:hypothetical protein